MIQLVVEDYCQQCLDFTPDVTKPERINRSNESFGYSDTIVKCKYHKRCEAIRRYLEQQAKGEANG